MKKKKTTKDFGIPDCVCGGWKLDLPHSDWCPVKGWTDGNPIVGKELEELLKKGKVDVNRIKVKIGGKKCQN